MYEQFLEHKCKVQCAVESVNVLMMIIRYNGGISGDMGWKIRTHACVATQEYIGAAIHMAYMDQREI